MRTRRRAVLVMVLTTIAVLAGLAAYGVAAHRAARQAGAAPVATTTLDAVRSGPHIVFRSTAPGADYGHVAVAALADPGGPRAFAPAACDRVDADEHLTVCLRTVRGVVTRFEAAILDAEGEVARTWPLAGPPSRTRLSGDGRLVAATSFVTGHSYAAAGFSTHTEVWSTAGESWGNLESFTLLADGRRVSAPDRNVWGVTFTSGDGFYATAASATMGRTWLVAGDLRTRRLVAVREGVECPSLSPDGTRVAFKTARGDGTWGVAVLELATGHETVLPEPRNVDDQAEWLDDDTVLYGLARPGQVGTSDVWAVDLAEGARPEVLVPHAWSPSVVRGPDGEDDPTAGPPPRRPHPGT